jgi:tRNA A37 threonylcarbamoyladenosine modification protein TsaB
MASNRMSVKRKKDRTTYCYNGNLEATIKASKEEVQKKRESQERVFLKWQYEKAKKAHEAYERRIEDLDSFIELAERELAKEHKKEGAADGEN